jgi:hypothetical protein
MPKLITPLTDIQLRNAKPAEKPYKLSDGGGLYIEVMPNGSKFWRMKVRQANGKESRLTFRSYPEVTLAGARAERSKAKQQQAAGIDPAQSKRIEKLQKKTAAVNTFEVLAREWHANKAATWAETTAKEALARLQNDVFPRVGNRPMVELDAPLMLDVLRQIETMPLMLGSHGMLGAQHSVRPNAPERNRVWMVSAWPKYTAIASVRFGRLRSFG